MSWSLCCEPTCFAIINIINSHGVLKNHMIRGEKMESAARENDNKES